MDSEGHPLKPLARPIDDGGNGADAQEPGVGQLLLWLHMMLRGRYALLVVLSVVLAGAMGYLGFRMGYKNYRSTGLIQITNPLSIGGESSDNGMQYGESFVSTQAGLLKSQRVIDMAMQSADWVALRRPIKETATEDFTQALTVLPKDRMIYVSFEDRDSRAVGVALKAVIEAYRRLYVEEDAKASQYRLDVLSRLVISTDNDDNRLKGMIDAIQSKYGTSDLGSIYNTKRGETYRLGELLQEVKWRLALVPSSTTQPTADAQEWTAVLDRLEMEELGTKDATLRELLNERAGLERQLRNLMTVHGYGADHPRVIEQKKALETCELDVAARANRVRESLKKAKPLAVAGVDLAELRKKSEWVQQQYDDAQKALKEIGTENLRLQELQEERATVRGKLMALRKRLDQLNLESSQPERIKILSDGSAAAAAVTDTRIRFTALGVIVGLMLAFGLSVLPSLVDRRFRAADDTRVGNFLGPVLGVLPELPRDLSDEEHAAMAAYCVHQTRALLQMRNHGAHGQALAVTSSLAGTGKTSLTLALGASFATSGSRTLLIDCDLVGGGLSARVSRMTRRKIGDLLRREGLITEQQLEQALIRARGEARRIGDVCVELGYVSQRDVQRLLESQDEAHLGVLDALGGESLDDCVAETGFPGLYILPLGTASARHCASISPAALRRLLKQARAQYDTVLIDTGPVPGSLEASVAVPQADGVILVVSKGEHRPTVARTVEYLRTVGANPVGVVFNRASLKEVAHNASTLHRSSAAFGASSSGMGLRMDPEQSRKSNRLGPMAQAVAGCAPLEEDEAAQ
jgi:Mrp family chromosome partitioning ATPase/uncharacterized protein involved in exopolysaccharide biosynthesis